MSCSCLWDCRQSYSLVQSGHRWTGWIMKVNVEVRPAWSKKALMEFWRSWFQRLWLQTPFPAKASHSDHVVMFCEWISYNCLSDCCQSYSLVQSGTLMNWLDYEAKWLKVKVMVRPVWSEKALRSVSVSLPDNIFALPAEVFLSCLAIISAVMVGGLFLWPALRYGTGYQTVWEIRPSAETPSRVHWRRFLFSAYSCT